MMQKRNSTQPQPTWFVMRKATETWKVRSRVTTARPGLPVTRLGRKLGTAAATSAGVAWSGGKPALTCQITRAEMLAYTPNMSTLEKHTERAKLAGRRISVMISKNMLWPW